MRLGALSRWSTAQAAPLGLQRRRLEQLVEAEEASVSTSELLQARCATGL